jgi:hypothetical protein
MLDEPKIEVRKFCPECRGSFRVAPDTATCPAGHELIGRRAVEDEPDHGDVIEALERERES